jgi:hypothetical protein
MKDILIKLLVLSLFSFGTFGVASAACTYDPYTYQTVCDNSQYNNNTGVSVQSVYTNQGYTQTGLYTPTPTSYGTTQKYPELCSVLRRTLIQGDEGQDVRRLQVALGQEGIAYIGATGYFGPVTKNAVKTFQLRNSINPTGNVGPVTMARMRSLWCAGVPTGGVNNPDYYNSSNNGILEVTIAPISSSAYGVTLGWNSKYANSCTINNETVQTNGQKVYNVSYETNFNITCLGYNNARVTKTITVRPNQTISNLPTVNLYINPTTAQVNSYATLYWTSTNAYSCTLNGQSVQTSGSQQILVSYNSTSYLLSCVGQNGQTVSSTIYSNGSGTNTNTGGASASITASMNNIYSGQGVTLNWTSTNTNSCTVSGGPTTFYGVTGSQYLNPTYTTTYYISCVPYNSGSNITNQVTVYVNGSGTGSGNVTANIYASPTYMSYSGQPVTISWSSVNASYCNISGGTLNLTNESTSGSRTVYPNMSTNYQITCYNQSGQNGSNYVYVSSSNSTNNVTANLYASSQNVTSGSSVTLTWSSINASYCNLTANGNNVLTNQSYAGNTLVYPTTNTNYQVTCYNSSNQSANGYINVTVTSNTPSVTMTPATSDLISGDSLTLSISTSNVTSCTLTGGNLNVSFPLNSSRSVTPTATTTYTVSCTGSYGTASDSSVVNVKPRILPSSVVFSPVAGTFSSAQNVTLSSSNSTSIRYTIDGTTPTCTTGSTYASAISVGSNQTIKAVGCNSVGSSSVGSQTYTINLPGASAPTASPAAGTYTAPQNVTLSSSNSTSIRYTVDGTIPTCSAGYTYSSPISISSPSVTLKAIACNSVGASSVLTFNYTITVPPTPTSSPAAGTYNVEQSVTLTSNGATSIRYTNDGSTPTCTTGSTYSGAIPVNSTQTIKAIGCNSIGASSVSTNTYTLNLTLPAQVVATPAAGTYNATQNVVLSSLRSTSIRYTTTGTIPSCTAGSVYSTPIEVDSDTTIKAIGCNSSGASAVGTFIFNF